MKRGISNEPIWYLPFSAGGVIAAMLVPIHLILFTLVIPLGAAADPGQSAMAWLVENPLTRIYLFVFVGGCLFHWAHRFRYTLVDLGLHGGKTPIAVLCYTSAIAGTAWSGWVFFSP